MAAGDYQLTHQVSLHSYFILLTQVQAERQIWAQRTSAQKAPTENGEVDRETSEAFSLSSTVHQQMEAEILLQTIHSCPVVLFSVLWGRGRDIKAAKYAKYLCMTEQVMKSKWDPEEQLLNLRMSNLFVRAVYSSEIS